MAGICWIYISLVEALPEPRSLLSTIHAMYITQNREALLTTFPLISNILARIAVLSASSSEAERLFSVIKRVKSVTTTKSVFPTKRVERVF